MVYSDIIEFAKVILPTLAILVSVIELIKSQKNTRKQIRVNKLEELLEIISILESYYTTLFFLSVDLIKLKNEEERNEKSVQSNELFERIEIFLKHLDTDKLQRQFSRLYVLANAYLPNNKTKIKILAFSRLFDAIFLSLIQKEIYLIRSDFKEGLPKPKKLTQFASSLQNEIIKEMRLGFDRLSDVQLITYFKDEFKMWAYKSFGHGLKLSTSPYELHYILFVAV